MVDIVVVQANPARMSEGMTSAGILTKARMRNSRM